MHGKTVADEHKFAKERLLHREQRFALWRVGANIGGESALLVVYAPAEDGGEPQIAGAALFDAGFAWCAPQTYDNICAVLGERPVDLLALTHSHYDHASGAGFLKQKMPGMQICAHAHTAHVFERPGAIATMRQLNDSSARLAGLAEFQDIADDMRVDRLLAEGGRIAVGGLTFDVLEAPGHTRDALAFWCAEAGLLVSCESGGVYIGPLPDDMGPGGEFPETAGCPVRMRVPADVRMMVEIPGLTGFGDCMSFVARASELPARVLVVPHCGAFAGEAVRDYFTAAEFWGRQQAQFVVDLHDRGWSDEQVRACFKRAFYTPYARRFQPEPAYDLNASYTIPRIIKELRG